MLRNASVATGPFKLVIDLVVVVVEQEQPCDIDGELFLSQLDRAVTSCDRIKAVSVTARSSCDAIGAISVTERAGSDIIKSNSSSSGL